MVSRWGFVAAGGLFEFRRVDEVDAGRDLAAQVEQSLPRLPPLDALEIGPEGRW